MHDACFICIGHIISAVVPGTDDTLCIRSDDLHTRAQHLLHFTAIVKTLLHYPHKHTHTYTRSDNIQGVVVFHTSPWIAILCLCVCVRLFAVCLHFACLCLMIKIGSETSETKGKVLSDNHPLIIKGALLYLTSRFGVRARGELIQPFSIFKVFFFFLSFCLCSFQLCSWSEWKKKNT